MEVHLKLCLQSLHSHLYINLFFLDTLYFLPLKIPNLSIKKILERNVITKPTCWQYFHHHRKEQLQHSSYSSAEASPWFRNQMLGLTWNIVRLTLAAFKEQLSTEVGTSCGNLPL